MGYAERVLQPGEKVAYRARLHWILMLPGIALTLIAGCLAIAAAVLPHGDMRPILLGVALLALMLGGYQLMSNWLTRISTEIIVTNRRIIVKRGLISRSSIEMNLDKVESVLVNQSILGRILDYGAIVIRGVGAGLEPVRNVAAPLEFHRHVNAGG